MSNSSPNHPHEEPGLSPLEFVRLQDELRRSNEELAEANKALQKSERELERRVDERTHELATLLQVSNNITSTLELESLLGLILDQLRGVVEYKLASISILENDYELLILAVRGDKMPQPGTRLFLTEQSDAHNMLIKRKPIFVPDLNADTLNARQMRNDLERQNLYGMGTWMNVPLVVREKSVGLLALAHSQTNYYNASRVDLTMAFANQAAVAIENARLYAKSRKLAALEERQKLARDLHDSVSQTLYGIVLGARTARTLLDREPAKAVESVDYVLSLADAGLAEMRALIFELRPESLQTEGLVTALGKLVNALGARYRLEVTLETGNEPDISIEPKESLYRIAQEAMNNIAKHARANHVDVKLIDANGQLLLSISDDGAGFDTSAGFPGHLGLHTMRERAEKVGGTFNIESAQNAGTRIQVMIPLVAR